MATETVSDYGQDMAFDLRQIYAKIAGEHLEDIADARKKEEYYLWYKCMEDLHIIIHHKFKKEEKDEEQYNKLRKEIIELAINNPDVWLAKDKQSPVRMEIERALGLLEMFLYQKMDDAKMFGQSGYIAGL